MALNVCADSDADLEALETQLVALRDRVAELQKHLLAQRVLLLRTREHNAPDHAIIYRPADKDTALREILVRLPPSMPPIAGPKTKPSPKAAPISFDRQERASAASERWRSKH